MRYRLTCLSLLLVLVVAVGCGGGGGGSAGQGKAGKRGKQQAVSVGAVLQQGTKLGTATVRAQAVPVGSTEFVLAGKKKSIFALGSAGVVSGVKNREAVRATGAVRRLSDQQAKTLAQAVTKGGRPPAEVARAGRTAGSPYLAVTSVEPARAGAKKSGASP